MKRIDIILIAACFITSLFLVSCSSEDPDNTTMDPTQQEDDTPDDPNDNEDPEEEEGTVFDGFSLNLSTGDFWEYYWITEEVNASQSNVSASTDNGSFRVELGDSQTIAGVAAFAVNVTGKPDGSIWGPHIPPGCSR